MHDNKLYAIFWALLSAVIISIAASVTCYHISENEIIAKSQNPALFECAISQERQKTAFCVNLSQAQK